jgi:membrane protease YdiL (CAAX protease family)
MGVQIDAKEARMLAKRELMKNTVRPIALALLSVGLGSLLVLMLEALLEIEVSAIYASGLTFVFAAVAAFAVFPRILRLPFGDVGVSEYLRRLGFFLPHGAWKHALLGALLAVCPLSGMLIGSVLSGRYELDWGTVTLSHTIFSINPGIWEEFFFRGVCMFVLLYTTKSLKRAALIQIVLFGLTHIKGAGLWDWVDVISVMIIASAFTYAAYKTRALVAGMVFHFLHDAFLFLPQLPGGDYVGWSENVAFYASLWLMVGVGMLLIRFASDSLGVKADEELYTLERVQPT